MKITNGDLVAWDIVAETLPTFAGEEVDLLPEIAESLHTKPRAIGNAPAAFDAADVMAISVSMFTAVLSVLRACAPKLFDASLDVGKDYLKSRWKTPSTASTHPPEPQTLPLPDVSTLARIRKLVVDAAAQQRLSQATGESLADAVVAHLALIGTSGA